MSLVLNIATIVAMLLMIGLVVASVMTTDEW